MQKLVDKIKRRVTFYDVIVEGWPSTGSTAIYQTCKQLGLKCVKKHWHWPSYWRAEKFFFAIRDPRDVILSIARRKYKKQWRENKERALLLAMEKFENKNPNAQLRKVQRDRRVILLRYELFFPDSREKLIQLIADISGKTINNTERGAILEHTSLEKNKKRALRLNSFSEYDKDTGVHGNHISNDGITGGWKNNFTREIAIKFQESLGDLLITSGYEKDNKWVEGY